MKKLFNKMFFVWDDNHRLQTWLLYIDRMHKNEENWHVDMDSIVFDNKKRVIKLLTTMTNLNKRDLNLFFGLSFGYVNCLI